jgi:hypothetical protein
MTKLTISKFGAPGFVKDIAEYAVAPQAFNEVRNVRFNLTGAQAFAGETEVMSQAPITPKWLKVFPPVDAPLWVYGDESKMYAYDGVHNEITRVSSTYTGSPQQRWQGEVLNGLGIFNNSADVPQLWSDFDASQKLVDLPNWPSTLRARFVRPWKNFLIAGYLTDTGVEKPYRVRWSDAAPPGTYPSSWALNDPTVFSGEKDIAETDDYIVDGLALSNLFIVYKQKSVYFMQFIDRPDVFAHDKLFGKGLLWRDCVQEFPAYGNNPVGHFVIGIDDAYVHTGARNSERSILEGTLRNWVFNQIDATNYFYCYTMANHRRSELYFCFPEAGETYPTLALVYNYVTQGVGVRDLFRSPFIYSGPILVAQDDDIWGVDADADFDLLTEDGETIDCEDGADLNWE